jgi:hypothetical protein
VLGSAVHQGHSGQPGREDQLHADTLRLLAANLRGRKEFGNASRLFGLARERGGDISVSIQQAMSTAEAGKSPVRWISSIRPIPSRGKMRWS